jgi:hypothetical protein
MHAVCQSAKARANPRLLGSISALLLDDGSDTRGTAIAWVSPFAPEIAA